MKGGGFCGVFGGPELFSIKAIWATFQKAMVDFSHAAEGKFSLESSACGLCGWVIRKVERDWERGYGVKKRGRIEIHTRIGK